MARRKKQEVQHVTLLNGNLSKVLMGLTAAGSLTVGGASFSKSSGTDERTAKLETKVEQLQKDGDTSNKKLERVDKRTIRIEEQIKAIGGKMGIKPSREDD